MARRLSGPRWLQNPIHWVFALVMILALLIGVGLLITAVFWKEADSDSLRQAALNDIAQVLPTMTYEQSQRVHRVLSTWGGMTHEEDWGKVLLRDLSIALIVGVILTVSVESYAGRLLRAQVAEDVLSGVFNKIIPTVIFDQVKSSVIRSAVLRKDWELRMSVYQDQHVARKDKDLYVSRTTIQYKIQNLESRTQAYTLSSGLSLDVMDQEGSGAPLPRFVKIQVAGKTFEGETLKEYLRHDGKQLSKTIDLKPNGEVDVLIELREIVRVPDAWYWATPMPAHGASISIETAAAPELEFKVEPYHPNKDLLEEPISGQQWRFEAGFLPWQGFELHVKRKQPAAVLQPPSTPNEPVKGDA